MRLGDFGFLFELSLFESAFKVVSNNSNPTIMMMLEFIVRFQNLIRTFLKKNKSETHSLLILIATSILIFLYGTNSSNSDSMQNKDHNG